MAPQPRAVDTKAACIYYDTMPDPVTEREIEEYKAKYNWIFEESE